MCTCGHPEKYHTLQVCAVLGCRCISFENRWKSRRNVVPLHAPRKAVRGIKHEPWKR